MREKKKGQQHKGSIINFKDEVVVQALNGKDPSPSYQELCQAIDGFEKKGNKVQIKQAVTWVEDTENVFGTPTGYSYKLAKITLFHLTQMHRCATLLHQANPIRTRVLSFISALAYRLGFALHGCISINADSTATKQKINWRKTRKTNVGSFVKVSVSVSASVAIKNKGMKTPWHKIDEAIKNISNDWEENGVKKPLKLFQNLGHVVVHFADEAASETVVFYECSDEDQKCGFIELKKRLIGGKDRGSTRYKDAMKNKAHIKSGEIAGMASRLLQTYQEKYLRTHGEIDPENFLNARVKEVTPEVVKNWMRVIVENDMGKLSPLIHIQEHFNDDTLPTIRFVNASKKNVLKAYNDFRSGFKSFPVDRANSVELRKWERVTIIEEEIAKTFIKAESTHDI